MASDCIGLGVTTCLGICWVHKGFSWGADGWVDGDNDDAGDDGDGGGGGGGGGGEGDDHHGGSLVGDLTTPLGTFVIASPGQVR